MNDLIVQLGLTGGAAWSARKLLGPALDAMGTDLASAYQSFRSKNLRSIFLKAEPLLEARDEVDGIEPISAKLLIHIVEKASLEDDDMLQELWAKLISTTSSDNEADTIFLTNALSQIARRDAEFFKNFARYSPFDFSKDLTPYEYAEWQNTYADQLRSLPLPLEVNTFDWQHLLTEQLWHYGFGWPASVVYATLPTKYENSNSVNAPIYTARHYSSNRKSFDVLDMVGLIRSVTAFASVGGYEASLVAYEMTRIGIELRRRTSKAAA